MAACSLLKDGDGHTGTGISSSASSSSKLFFSLFMAGGPPTAQLDPRIGLGLFAASQTQSLLFVFLPE